MPSKPKPSRRIRLEPLEARRLLSATAQPLALVDTASAATQVQSVPQFRPTYHIFNAGSLTPFQTAGPQGFTPSQIRSAYGLNQITFGGVTGDGSGQTIAIIDAYNDPTIQADLRAFDAAFSLPNPSLRVVGQSGTAALPTVDPAGRGNNNWEGEEALDVEWAHALAPGASLILVEAADASPSNLFAAANWARKQAGVSVVSMSFGGNETSSETQYDSFFTTPAGHGGVTFVASTGDAGAPAGYPALSSNVVAVGGTSLAVDSLNHYQSETGWSGSGGGLSTVESQPSYQKGVVTQSATFRATPDVAFDADPSTGVAIYDSYNNGTTTPWEIIGGTSLSAPSWAGIIAVADQGRVAAGKGTLDSATDTLPLIYKAPASVFHDITTGNNGFAAKAGYDLVTGRGTPQANLLIPYLVSGTTPPPVSGPTIASVSADSTNLTEGTPLTLTANGVSDVGGSGLAVTFFEETNGVAGLQTNPTTGDFSFTPVTDGSNAITVDTTNLTPGNYTFYAQLTDNAGGASPQGINAPSVTVTVTAPSSGGPSISGITADPSPVISGNTLTLTANGVSDSQATVRRVYFYQEINGIPGLQTGPGGDFAFRPTNALSGFTILLDTTGVTGSLTFYALAVDTAGNVSAEGDAAPAANVNITSGSVPNDPTGLTATAVSSTEIDLAFSQVDSGQTGFTIQRASDPLFAHFTRLFTINRSNVLTYSDTALSPGTRYYYRVEAFNDAGPSGFSNTAHATTFSAASHLAFSQQPATTVVGAVFNPVVVSVEDRQGNVITTDNSNVTIALSAAPVGAVLSGTLTVAAVNGVATFSDLSLNQDRSFRLTASDGLLASAFSRVFAVTPQMVFGQQPTDVVAGQRITPAVTVILQDSSGHVLVDHQSVVTLTVNTGPAGGKLVGAVTAITKNGVATFNNLELLKAGSYTLSATDGRLPPIVSAGFNVTPAAAARAHFSLEPSSSTVATAFDVQVQLLDEFGNLAGDGSTVRIFLSLHPAHSVLAGTLTQSVLSGTADFPGLSLDTPGLYSLQATDGNLPVAGTRRFRIS